MTPAPLKHAPIAGGGPCDVCGWRTFRARRFGGWRHAGCEPFAWHLTPPEQAARTHARLCAHLAAQPAPADDDHPTGVVLPFRPRTGDQAP